MVVQGPSQPAQFRDDVQSELVELHFGVGFDGDADGAGQVGGAFGEGEGFEHGDGEEFALGFPAEDEPGEGGEGVGG